MLEQLQTSAQSEVVKLKLDNSRLRAELEALRENVSIETVSLQTALDSEKKKAALKVKFAAFFNKILFIYKKFNQVEEILSSERVHRQLQSTLEDTVRELTNEKKELGSQLQDSAIQSQTLATELQASYFKPQLSTSQNSSLSFSGVQAADYGVVGQSVAPGIGAAR